MFNLSALRPVWEALSELTWPTRCVGCELPGELLCDACRAQLPCIEQAWACPMCGAPFGYLTCTACKCDWNLSVLCTLSYEGLGSRIPTLLKDAHELRLAYLMAELMAQTFNTTQLKSCSLDAICFVPATEAAYRRRGFDHMQLVAEALSRELSLPVTDVLLRAPAQDQRLLTREERQSNLKDSVQVLADVFDATLLLIDDVVTTGASMQACAHALYEAGAQSVKGLALSRVW